MGHIQLVLLGDLIMFLTRQDEIGILLATVQVSS